MTMRQFALWFSKQKPRLLPHFHGHKKYMLRALVELTRWSRKDSKNFLKIFIPGCQCSPQIHISYLIAVGPRKLWGVLDHWKRDRILGAAAAKINAFPSLNFPWFSLLPTLILYLIPLPLWYLFHLTCSSSVLVLGLQPFVLVVSQHTAVDMILQCWTVEQEICCHRSSMGITISTVGQV